MRDGDDRNAVINFPIDQLKRIPTHQAIAVAIITERKTAGISADKFERCGKFGFKSLGSLLASLGVPAKRFRKIAPAADVTTSLVIEPGLTSRALADFGPRRCRHVASLVLSGTALGFDDPFVARAGQFGHRNAVPQSVDEAKSLVRR